MKNKVRTALLLLGLFLAAWLPRVLALDAFVTTDERKWLARSANFYQAVSHADFVATFQREHPGVTVMWAGTLGFLTYFPTYAQVAPGQFAWENEDLEDWLSTHSTLTPLQLLAAGRWWIALGIALAITASYFPLCRLFGAPVAAVTTLFIAWDPFFIALSRQLHPDGLVSSLIFLALLLFLSWLYSGQTRRYLVASGIVMGLAWLTKTPAIFLVPIGALLIGVELIRRRRGPTPPQPYSPTALLLGYIGWGMVADPHLCCALASNVAKPTRHAGRYGGRDEQLCGGACQPQLLHGPAHQRSRAFLLSDRGAVPHNAGQRIRLIGRGCDCLATYVAAGSLLGAH